MAVTAEPLNITKTYNLGDVVYDSTTSSLGNIYECLTATCLGSLTPGTDAAGGTWKALVGGTGDSTNSTASDTFLRVDPNRIDIFNAGVLRVRLGQL